MEVMEIIPITSSNAHIFEVFVQDYEAEFSAITKKEPNAEGRFALEADWHPPNQGFYQFMKGKPVGFAIRGMAGGGAQILLNFTFSLAIEKRGLGNSLLLLFLIDFRDLGKFGKFQLL